MNKLVVVNKLEVPKKEAETVKVKIGMTCPDVFTSETEMHVFSVNEEYAAKFAVKMTLFIQKQMRELAEEYEKIKAECVKE